MVAGTQLVDERRVVVIIVVAGELPNVQGRASPPGSIKLSEAFFSKATAGFQLLLQVLPVPSLVSGWRGSWKVPS